MKPDEETVDLGGAHVYPGFIDAHTHIGMWEDGSPSKGTTATEETDPVQPQLRAIDAVNPMDRCFSEAVDAGITTVLTGPGSANPIGGQFAALKTFGRRVDKMIVRAPRRHENGARRESEKCVSREKPGAFHAHGHRCPHSRSAYESAPL